MGYSLVAEYDHINQGNGDGVSIPEGIRGKRQVSALSNTEANARSDIGPIEAGHDIPYFVRNVINPAIKRILPGCFDLGCQSRSSGFNEKFSGCIFLDSARGSLLYCAVSRNFLLQISVQVVERFPDI